MISKLLIAVTISMFWNAFIYGDDSKLDITIQVSSRNTYCVKFLKNQLTPKVLQELSTCPIDFRFQPCAESALVGNKLTCMNGEEECQIDRIFACATDHHRKTPVPLLQFVSCMTLEEDPVKAAPKCASDYKFDWDKIKECVDNGTADKSCNTYHDEVQHTQAFLVPGVLMGKNYNETLNDEAAGDFKGITCRELKRLKLECSACKC